MDDTKSEIKTRVLVVDDQPAVVDAIRDWLLHEPGLEIVGHAAGGSEALELVARLQPDVVLVDVRMPPPDGISTARAIRELAPATRVIVMTIYDSPATREAAKQAGAAEFVAKHDSAEALVEAILRVAGQSRRDR